MNSIIEEVLKQGWCIFYKTQDFDKSAQEHEKNGYTKEDYYTVLKELEKHNHGKPLIALKAKPEFIDALSWENLEYLIVLENSSVVFAMNDPYTEVICDKEDLKHVAKTVYERSDRNYRDLVRKLGFNEIKEKWERYY